MGRARTTEVGSCAGRSAWRGWGRDEQDGRAEVGVVGGEVGG